MTPLGRSTWPPSTQAGSPLVRGTSSVPANALIEPAVSGDAATLLSLVRTRSFNTSCLTAHDCWFGTGAEAQRTSGSRGPLTAGIVPERQSHHRRCHVPRLLR